jgi:hypothetical protein
MSSTMWSTSVAKWLFMWLLQEDISTHALTHKGWWWPCWWSETTSLNCGRQRTYCSSSLVIYEHWGLWCNDIDGDDSWFFHQTSVTRLTTKSSSRKTGRIGRRMNLAFEISLFILRSDFFTYRKILRDWARLYFLPEESRAADFHRP